MDFKIIAKTVLCLLICLMFISVAGASPLSLLRRDRGQFRHGHTFEDSYNEYNTPKSDDGPREFAIPSEPPEDNFSIKEIASAVSPVYRLAESFPADKIQAFKDFVAFNATIEETEDLLSSELIEVRLNSAIPIQYEDFLATVSMSLHFLPHSRKMCFSLSRTSFFIDHVLDPLSEDLKIKKYRGYHFTGNDLPNFYREYAVYCHQRYIEHNFLHEIPRGKSTLSDIPSAILLSENYANTYLLMRQGDIRGAYNIMNNIPYISLEKISGERPYSFYGDNARYQWFLFFQKELRYAGYVDYADEILQTELEHYRELVVWRLKRYAYTFKKLYESNDDHALSFLKNAMEVGYDDLRQSELFKRCFDEALVFLRDIDRKIRSVPVTDTTRGVLVLPWIDRKALDWKMGISVDISKNSLPGKSCEVQVLDTQTIGNLREKYEWLMTYIRVLAVITEKLYLEKKHEALVFLHERLQRSQYEWKMELGPKKLLENNSSGNILLPWVEVRKDWFGGKE